MAYNDGALAHRSRCDRHRFCFQSGIRDTHSAIFAEVKVDEQLRVVRVTRVVNAVAAGRIINIKTAASQIMGSVVWGIGMVLHEETLVVTASAAS